MKEFLFFRQAQTAPALLPLLLLRTQIEQCRKYFLFFQQAWTENQNEKCTSRLEQHRKKHSFDRIEISLLWPLARVHSDLCRFGGGVHDRCQSGPGPSHCPLDADDKTTPVIKQQQQLSEVGLSPM